MPILTPINSPVWGNSSGINSTGAFTFNGNNYLSITPKQSFYNILNYKFVMVEGNFLSQDEFTLNK